MWPTQSKLMINKLFSTHFSVSKMQLCIQTAEKLHFPVLKYNLIFHSPLFRGSPCSNSIFFLVDDKSYRQQILHLQ